MEEYNYFNLSEGTGRYKLKLDFDSSPVDITYSFTTDPYDRLDAFATANTRNYPKYSIEIKDRDIEIVKYWNDGYILELSKYNALMETIRYEYNPLYVNYFKDCRVVWKVANIDITNRVVKKWCTATTVGNYGERVLKDVILLYPNEGIIKKY